MKSLDVRGLSSQCNHLIQLCHTVHLSIFALNVVWYMYSGILSVLLKCVSHFDRSAILVHVCSTDCSCHGSVLLPCIPLPDNMLTYIMMKFPCVWLLNLFFIVTFDIFHTLICSHRCCILCECSYFKTFYNFLSFLLFFFSI